MSDDPNTTQELDKAEIMRALNEHKHLMASLRDEVLALRSELQQREKNWKDIMRQTVYYMMGLLGIK